MSGVKKNEFIINYINIIKNYYNINSINFIIDNENNFYFYVNENKKILFYNFFNINIELLSFLNFNKHYLIELHLFNINNTNIKLNEIEIIYINKLNNDKKYIKTIKEKLKDSLK